MTEQVEDYEKLEDYSVHHSRALNGLFEQDENSFVVNLFEDGYSIHFGSDTDVIETLDRFNSLFPIRGSLYVLEEGKEYSGEGSLREHDGHAYHMYPSEEWQMVTNREDEFGFTWRQETSHVTNNFEHTVAILANEDHHDLNKRSYQPIKEGVPLFYEEFDEDSKIVQELYKFCKNRPEDFLK